MKQKLTILVTMLSLLIVIPSTAQTPFVEKLYGNVDWQLNLPIDNKFADTFSGWGAHAEVGYRLTETIGLGLFVTYHTNNKYIDRATREINDGTTVTTDQQHSIFHLPFGAAFRYTLPSQGLFEPYFSAQLGASYSKISTDMNIFRVQDKKWGFHASPEIGVNIFPTADKMIGFNVATYYSHSTNKSEVFGYSIKGLNNWGIRLGVAF